jgi:hypothetical protein
LLLASDSDALATTTGTSIGLGTLTTGRETSSVSLTTEAIDFDQALDVETFDSAEVAFDLIIAALLDLFAHAADFFFGEVLDAAALGQSDFFDDMGSGRAADTMDISKGYDSPFVSRQIYTGNTGHLSSNNLEIRLYLSQISAKYPNQS